MLAGREEIRLRGRRKVGRDGNPRSSEDHATDNCSKDPSHRHAFYSHRSTLRSIAGFSKSIPNINGNQTT
jgi:hypothetical protein